MKDTMLVTSVESVGYHWRITLKNSGGGVITMLVETKNLDKWLPNSKHEVTIS